MSEVTAEMIERGRGADPKSVAERRRLAVKVREAREKLTSSGSGHRSYDLELLRLYAEGRRASAPAMALLGLLFALISVLWAKPSAILLWLGLDIFVVSLSYWLAGTFLAAPETTLSVNRWRRQFILAETLQGTVCALIVLFMRPSDEPVAMTFVLIALLLIAAMNATTTASIPVAVYGNLAPFVIAIVAYLQPTSIEDKSFLLAALACSTLLYFVVLARKLYQNSIETLSFQAEKDTLIAELEQATSNSDLARRRAEEANLAKSRFLATMSHELRTPLNAILGFSEVMKGELFGAHAVAAYKDYSDDIHSSGHHLLMLINEILDLSRVEAGRYDLREESISLGEMVEECRHLVSLRADKRSVTIQEAVEVSMPRLWADARAVRQVVLNLLSNAIKFTPQGGQIFIKVGWTAVGGQYFSVRDTGPGIPESEIPIVMSSFGRGTLAQKNADEGSGLGLPIVKGLVELHGGTFTLKSKVREGTEVIVVFPPERVMSALPQLDVEAPEPRTRSRPAA